MFRPAVMLAEIKTMITPEHDNRGFIHHFTLLHGVGRVRELRQQLPHQAIDKGDTGIIPMAQLTHLRWTWHACIFIRHIAQQL